jgi:hypothetical protein
MRDKNSLIECVQAVKSYPRDSTQSQTALTVIYFTVIRPVTNNIKFRSKFCYWTREKRWQEELVHQVILDLLIAIDEFVANNYVDDDEELLKSKLVDFVLSIAKVRFTKSSKKLIREKSSISEVEDIDQLHMTDDSVDDETAERNMVLKMRFLFNMSKIKKAINLLKSKDKEILLRLFKYHNLRKPKGSRAPESLNKFLCEKYNLTPDGLRQAKHRALENLRIILLGLT